MYSLNDVMDRVCDDIQKNLKEKGPVKSASWEGGHKSQTLQVYTTTLSNLARTAIDRCRGGDVIETGTDHGMGTLSLAYGIRYHTKNKVITFDIREATVDDTRARAQALFDGAPNIEFVHGDSDLVAQGMFGSDFAFAYIDGDHTHEGCYKDLMNIVPHMKPHALVLCHDLHPRRPNQNGVREAILKCIKAYPEWTCMRLGGFGLLGKGLTL